MATNQTEGPAYDLFDKLLGSMHGRPDIVCTKPSTVQSIKALVGCAQTFIVQTYREKPGEDGKGGGDFIFLQAVSREGTVRIPLPPEVADAIARQREALTTKNRSRASTESMRARMAAGEQPGFKRKKK